MSANGGMSSLSLWMSFIHILQFPTLLVYLFLPSMRWGCVATQTSTGTRRAGPWGMLCFSETPGFTPVHRGLLYHYLDYHPLTRLPAQLDHLLVHRQLNCTDHRLIDRFSGVAQLGWSIWPLILLGTLLVCVTLRLTILLARARRCTEGCTTWSWTPTALWRRCVLMASLWLSTITRAA